MPEPKFQFYEIVRICSDSQELAEINGAIGTILGISEYGDPEYGYGVFIDRDDCVWSVSESNLESTGVIKQRADFYDDNVSIRVQVDEQNRGIIAD